MRTPRVLKEITWIITDNASITKMPPITTSNNSVLVKIAMAAKAPPKAKEPVSPMNTLAGFTLYTKKPRHTAATIAPK